MLSKMRQNVIDVQSNAGVTVTLLGPPCGV